MHPRPSAARAQRGHQPRRRQRAHPARSSPQRSRQQQPSPPSQPHPLPPSPLKQQQPILSLRLPRWQALPRSGVPSPAQVRSGLDFAERMDDICRLPGALCLLFCAAGAGEVCTLSTLLCLFQFRKLLVCRQGSGCNGGGGRAGRA
jgi:hypothetical protein